MQETVGRAGAPLRMGAIEWGLIALQSMLWGSSYFFIATVQGQVPALTIAALRTLPAAAVLLLIVLSFGYRLPATLAEWRLFIGFSVFNTVLPFVLIVWGQSRTTGGMAAILNATAPLFGSLISTVGVAHEKVRSTWAGLAWPPMTATILVMPSLRKLWLQSAPLPSWWLAKAEFFWVITW